MPTLTNEQETERLIAMRESKIGEITEIRESTSGNGWSISLDHSGFFFSNEYGVVPEVGMMVRLYTQQGSLIRGVDIDGEPVFFKTNAEMEIEAQERKEHWDAEKKERFEKECEELDAKFEALPEPFQRRIRWFRDHNPDFRWDWESYEMASCVDAVKIAAWAKDQVKRYGGADGGAGWVQTFRDANAEAQRDWIPDLAYDEHSGNTFGMAVLLALHYAVDPEWVFFDHGAGVPLTGCEDYGCHHPRPGVEEFIARHQEKEA